MGGSNHNNRPRTILKGKANYAVWVPTYQIELRQEECFEALSADLIDDPTAVDDTTTKRLIEEWLSAREEVPAGGFSAQKITANRAK